MNLKLINMLHVISEKIKTTVGKEDSVQASLIILLRIRTSESSDKERGPRAVLCSALKWCVEFDL